MKYRELEKIKRNFPFIINHLDNKLFAIQAGWFGKGTEILKNIAAYDQYFDNQQHKYFDHKE